MLAIRSRGWIAIFAGAVLLTAAVFKLFDAAPSVISTQNLNLEPWVRVGLIEWELILGVWLLSRWLPELSWALAVATFAAFLVVSFRAGWIGLADCGCFGQVETSPWVAFGIDLAVLVALMVGRPNGLWRRIGDNLRSPEAALRLAGKWLLAAVLVFASSWALIELGLVKLSRASVRAETPIVDMGHGQGGTIEALVVVRNDTSRTIRLIGGTSDCSCVTTSTLPVEIVPGGSVTVPIFVKIPCPSGGPAGRGAIIWTDDPETPQIRLRLVYRCK